MSKNNIFPGQRVFRVILYEDKITLVIRVVEAMYKDGFKTEDEPSFGDHEYQKDFNNHIHHYDYWEPTEYEAYKNFRKLQRKLFDSTSYVISRVDEKLRDMRE